MTERVDLMRQDAFPERELDLARDAFNRGDVSAASRHIEQALTSNPNCAEAHFGKAMLAATEDRNEDALASFAEALRCDPHDAESLNQAAVVALKLQRGDLAEFYATRLVRLRPTDPNPRFLRSNALWLLGRGKEALEAINRAIALDPENARCLAAKAKLLAKSGENFRAIELYRKSLLVDPHPGTAIELAERLMEESLVEEAVALIETYAPKMIPAERPDALIARLYTEAQMFDSAAPYWISARRAATTHLELLQGRVPAEILAGRLSVAEELIREALTEDPSAAQFYRPLTSIRKITARDAEWVATMERLLAENCSDPAIRQDLNYALGKAYHDLAEYGRAMAHYDEANRLAYERSSVQRRFDPAAWRSETDFLTGYFTKARLDELRRAGVESETPLFVAGMIRSGTTLVEQILSCHSRIKSGGEKTFWYDYRDAILDRTGARFDTVVANRMARRYLEEVGEGEPSFDRIVDKNPANFYVAGILNCVFPNAKMIHIKRHPIDNLLSIWMTPITTGAPYVYHREHLVSGYREYLRLAKHWETILPEESFRTFSYEDLTNRATAEIDEMFAFVGLPVEAQCFHPETNPRTVRTPSVYQVRQPINTDSQEKWKRYEPWLGVFAEFLE